MIISGIIELAKVLPRAIAKARGYRKKCENCGCDVEKKRGFTDISC